MKRRVLLGCTAGAMATSAGCVFSGDGAEQQLCENSCYFDSFTIINKRRRPVKAAVTIKRNGKTVVDTDVTVPDQNSAEQNVEELIDLLEDRSGRYVVTVETQNDEITIPVTESAGADTYTLVVVISEGGGLAVLTNQ